MTVHVLLGALAGAVITAAVMWLLLHRRVTTGEGHGGPSAGELSGSALPAGVSDVLGVLASTAIVVDVSDVVVSASPSANAYGLVRRNGLVHEDIRRLVRLVREDQMIREEVLLIGRGSLDRPTESVADRLVMGVRVAPLGEQHILVLVQDKTYEQRVEKVRRDFVANVSHELKTPVGGLSLLAEAVLDAKDDPAAVERFASRMQLEARRLSRLVTDIVDLTRLQVADSLHEPAPVDVAAVVREAVDSLSVPAEAKGIALDAVVGTGLTTFGDEDLLVTAVRNLVLNAVNYSDPATRVAIRAHRRGETVEIVVADHGSGIPPAEQDRIFERFYRIDPARSRATGGTGLGLSIVKHVCAIHGGTVSVWSQEGKGSTFTIRLPLRLEADAPEPAAHQVGATPDPFAPSGATAVERDNHTRQIAPRQGVPSA
ncbi:MAG: sensor histidine kinase [Dermatophilaceae bacterium]|nr:two-component sensor histidine kinase [Intrasporangiaceae bacterium]